jgi:hypothetical protein
VGTVKPPVRHGRDKMGIIAEIRTSISETVNSIFADQGTARIGI